MSAGANTRDSSIAGDHQIVGEDLHADVVRAGVAVLLDPSLDRRLVTPHDQGVDEPVAAAVGHVLIAVAESPPVVRVVRQVEVDRQVLPGERAGAGRVGAQHHRLLRCDEPVRAEGVAHDPGVLGRDQVGVRAGAAVAGEVQHLRTERSEHTVLDRQGRRCCVEAVEVLAHPGQRLGVLTRADPLDERGVADTDADEQPPAVAIGQLGTALRRLGRLVEPQVEDPCRHRGGRRRAEQRLDRREQIAADVGDPQRAVAELLELGRCVRDGTGVAVAQRHAPDAGPSECRCGHGCSLPAATERSGRANDPLNTPVADPVVRGGPPAYWSGERRDRRPRRARAA